MRRIQKVIRIILVIMLILVQLLPIINVSAEEADTLTITTYGENEDGIRSDLVTNTATLTVAGFDSENEFSAYKIIDTFYNKDINEITYDFTSDFREFLNQSEDYGDTFTIEKYFELTSDEVDEYCSRCTSVITTSTLNKLVSKYTTYIRNNNISGIKMITEYNNQATSGNYYASAVVSTGAYLILPNNILDFTSSSDSAFGFARNLYGVMVGNVVFTVNETTAEWELNDTKVLVKEEESELTTSLFGFSFSDYFGVMDGTISVEDIDFNFYQNISSFINNKSIYYIEIGKMSFPTNAINKVYQVEINLTSGITYDANNIYFMNGDMPTIISENKIIDIDNATLLGTLTTSSNKIIIEFNLENVAAMDWSAITLGFDVELNNSATVGDTGNVITATLTTTDDPYVENSTTTITTTNTIYTYGLELSSFGEKSDDGTAPLLTGAKYEIYSKYTDSILSNKIGEFTVGDDGKAAFAGVPSGTIYLKQVKAPTGYQLIKEPIAVKIATEDATAGTKEGYYQVITYNDAMWYLPSTGGVGTVIYTLIGLVVIGISSVFVIKYKKSVKNSSLI